MSPESEAAQKLMLEQLMLEQPMLIERLRGKNLHQQQALHAIAGKAYRYAQVGNWQGGLIYRMALGGIYGDDPSFKSCFSQNERGEVTP